MVGGTWIIGFLIIPFTNVSCQSALAIGYIFAILNSLQGKNLRFKSNLFTRRKETSRRDLF